MRQLLEVHRVHKAFGGIQAVRNCTFSVEEGSITALIGPNGAGKTTMLDIVNGILAPDEGQIVFDGTEVTGLLPHSLARLGISRTFQIARGLGEMTVLENMIVSSPARGIRGLLGSRILKKEHDRALELLEFVGIAELAALDAEKLSYGQKKLLELASAFMSEAKLVLLDEPAGGVNPALLERIMDRVQRMNEIGITFLFVEHNMDMVMRISDRVIVMAQGEVMAEGPPAAIREDDAVLDAYLGRA